MNNNCIFVGRLTKDLEIKTTKQSGLKYCDFSLAIDNGKDKNGERRPATFPNFRVWDKRAETMVQYLHKGNLVMVKASYTVEKWQNDKGENRYNHLFIVNNFMFLESKSKENHEPQEPDYLVPDDDEIDITDNFEQLSAKTVMNEDYNPELQITDEDLPF